jgi:hypothetical protein
VKRGFVDTGAFLALLVDEDANHSSGQELFKRAAEECWKLITTNAVVYETYAVLLIRARDWRRATYGWQNLKLPGPVQTPLQQLPPQGCSPEGHPSLEVGPL